MKRTLIATVLALVTGSVMAAQPDTASVERPCGSSTKCWREFAILERTQAQNAVGLYWLKIEERHKRGAGSSDYFPQCKTDDQACWKNLAKVARAANTAVSALENLDKEQGVR